MSMWVKGDCGWQADGTTGLPPAPEIARVLRHSRFVPDTVMGAPWRNCLSRDDLGDTARGIACGRQMIGYASPRSSLAKPPTTSDERTFARTFRGPTDLRP